MPNYRLYTQLSVHKERCLSMMLTQGLESGSHSQYNRCRCWGHLTLSTCLQGSLSLTITIVTHYYITCICVRQQEMKEVCQIYCFLDSQ